MKSSILALLLLLVVGGCQSGDTMTETANGQEQLFKAQGDFGGAHILVAYQGAMRADPSITRTKEEALEKAQSLIAQLQEDPDLFGDLARAESDGPSGPKGGDLGFWEKGRMVPEFDEAIEKLEIGQVTAEPVETSFGYHVIIRNSLLVPHYGAEAFVINFAGAAQRMAEVTRTREQADSLAAALEGQVTGANFEEMALEHNDLAEGKMFIGVFQKNDPNISGTPFYEGLTNIEIGEAAGPFEFPVGLAFIRRVSVDQRAGAHILISYLGAQEADARITRSKDEARDRAAELIADLKADPSQFEEFAKAHSDGPSGPEGGDLGVWFRGQMVEAFDLAIDDLDVDEITNDPVETPYGYHVIVRKEVPAE